MEVCMDCMEMDLWCYNVAKVIIVDVTDDYVTLAEPLPTVCYPILKVIWLPAYQLPHHLLRQPLLSGYAYDRHETIPSQEGTEHWYVGVVHQRLT